MPKIIAYLSHARPARFYDEAALVRLQLVYDRACSELQIGLPDSRRERLASIIFEISDVTDDTDEFVRRAVAIFRQ